MPTFYRIVKADPPTDNDFRSQKDLRRRPPPPDADPVFHRMWEGISVNATEHQARKKAQRMPALGRYVAELKVPEGGPIRYERTPGGPGHHTLWGEPAAIHRCVVRVEPV